MKTWCYATVLVVMIGVFSLVSKNVTYADDAINPPTVTSLTGPTSGYVGKSYTFSATVTSTAGTYGITFADISVNTNPDTSYNSDTIVELYSGSSGCSETLCNLQGTFIPAASGTYYIYDYVETATDSCDTHPALVEHNCLDSRGKYIAFVVTEEPPSTSGTLPSTGITNNSVIMSMGMGVLILGVIITWYPRISNVVLEKIVSKKKTNIEKKYK